MKSLKIAGSMIGNHEKRLAVFSGSITADAVLRISALMRRAGDVPLLHSREMIAIHAPAEIHPEMLCGWDLASKPDESFALAMQKDTDGPFIGDILRKYPAEYYAGTTSDYYPNGNRSHPNGRKEFGMKQ